MKNKMEYPPTDAEALKEVITSIIEDAFDDATHGTLGGYGPDRTDCQDMIKDCVPKILSLFNPSGAAPQAGKELSSKDSSSPIPQEIIDWIAIDKGMSMDDQWMFKEGAFAMYRKLRGEFAPQAIVDPKCELCDGSGYVTVKEAGGDTTSQMECPNCEARNDAMEENDAHPPSSLPQENGTPPTHIEALNLAKETLQWMFDNMTADDKRDIQDSHDRPANACHAIELALESAPVPPAAGPVWVTPQEKKPEIDKRYYLRSRLEKYKKYVGRFVLTENLGMVLRLHSEADHSLNIHQVEYLDETNSQQVFTREQVEEMLKSYARVGYPEGNEMIKISEKSICNWFQTNFPPPINK